jgi:hypothetical protein
MATIEDVVREQLDTLMRDLLAQRARTLTGIGIGKQRRKYLKESRKKDDGVKKLPPVDVVLAALIMLRKEIVIEGVQLQSGSLGAHRYAIVAVERPLSSQATASLERQPVQLSLLASLDFPASSVATIERAERKGPNRVELALTVELGSKVG